MDNNKVRIVIADDDELAVCSLRRLLAPFEEEIEVIGIAENGRKGVEMIDRLRPEVAFIDVEMPLLDGFDVCRQLAHTPLLVFTSVSDGYDREAEAAGAVAVLLKPIGHDDIRSLMNRIRATVRLRTTLQYQPGRN